MDGVRLISLQQGPGTDQIATAPWRDRLNHLGEKIDRDGAFLDSAAIASIADLVVTSDTALAHLAGAMGVPVWLALSHVPDWRWGPAGEDCAWYPTMRLFRQPAPGDWRGVFTKMADALAEMEA
jgi:ADP-heptose:LPS heptosyltransferase